MRRIPWVMVGLLGIQVAHATSVPVLQSNVFSYINQPQDATAHVVMLGGYRAYNAQQGVFLKQDSYSPFVSRQTINGFDYGAGNPVFSVDPTGHHWTQTDTYIAIGVGVGVVLLGLAFYGGYRYGYFKGSNVPRPLGAGEAASESPRARPTTTFMPGSGTDGATGSEDVAAGGGTSSVIATQALAPPTDTLTSGAALLQDASILRPSTVSQPGALQDGEPPRSSHSPPRRRLVPSSAGPGGARRRVVPQQNQDMWWWINPANWFA